MAEAVDGLQDVALTWSGRSLDVGRIETELGKLRYMAAGEPSGGEAFAIRTSLLNMVVYAEHQEGAAAASTVIEDLSTHHPSRALVVIGKPSNAESHIEAELAAHCHITPGLEQSVCCEEVIMKVTGRAGNHLHSLVVPLLIPDLPIYVWWTERLPDEPHQFDELLQIADRVIVDSDSFDDQLDGLMRLFGLVGDEPGTALGDLSWSRLSTWRQLVQQQRQVNAVQHHLGSVASVEVTFASAPDGGGLPAAQAFLFLGWLAGELGWDTTTAVAGASGEVKLRDRDDRPVSLFSRPVAYPAVDPGWLVSVKIACASALVTISRTGDPYHITIRTEHAGVSGEGHVRVEKESSSELLARELDETAHDPEYRRVLACAIPLIAAAR